MYIYIYNCCRFIFSSSVTFKVELCVICYWCGLTPRVNPSSVEDLDNLFGKWKEKIFTLRDHSTVEKTSSGAEELHVKKSLK